MTYVFDVTSGKYPHIDDTANGHERVFHCLAKYSWLHVDRMYHFTAKYPYL